MSVQLPMFDLTTSEASGSVISSPVSGDGVSRFDSPDGPMTDLSGQAPVPASHSQVRGAAAASTMTVIFGLRGSRSSRSADLQRSLGSRLRTRLDSRGSTLFSTTWKVAVTPAGRQLCQLAVSGRRTGDSGSGSWPTPTVNDATGSAYTYSQGNHGKPTLKLPGAVRMHWPTPAARDHKSDRSQKTDVEIYANGGKVGKPLPRNVLKHLGVGPYGTAAQTGSSEQLAPEFVSWLMGYPTAWDVSGAMATPSSRPSPRPSSKAIAKPKL